MKDSSTTAVDFFKFFFSIMVVAIHTHAFLDFGAEKFVTNHISGFSVPFFFIASGYFLGKKMLNAKTVGEYRNYGFKYFKRLMRPYFIWAFIQFFVQIFVDFYKSDFKNITGIIINKFHYWIVSSPGGGLWYVQASLILVLILCITNSKKFRIAVSVVLFTAFLIPSTTIWLNISELYDKIFITTNNFVFSGIYFVLGFQLSRFHIIEKLNIKLFLGIFIVFYFLFFIKIDDTLTKILGLVVSLIIFELSLKLHMPYSIQLSVVLRRISTIIYFTHMPVKFFFQLVVDIFAGGGYETLVWISTVLVLLIYSYLLFNTKTGNKIEKIFY